MAMSASSTELAPGRTTRTLRIRRSYGISVVSPGGRAGRRRAPSPAGAAGSARKHRSFPPCSRALPDRSPRAVPRDRGSAFPWADQGRQAKVERVAVEQAGEGLGDQGGDAEMLQCRRRLLAARAGAEVAAADHDVARFYAC